MNWGALDEGRILPRFFRCPAGNFSQGPQWSTCIVPQSPWIRFCPASYSGRTGCVLQPLWFESAPSPPWNDGEGRVVVTFEAVMTGDRALSDPGNGLTRLSPQSLCVPPATLHSPPWSNAFRWRVPRGTPQSRRWNNPRSCKGERHLGGCTPGPESDKKLNTEGRKVI